MTELEKYPVEFDQYLKNTGYSRKTVSLSDYTMKKFLCFLREKRITGYGDITRENLEEFKGWVIEKYGMKETSANRYRKGAHRFLFWLSTHKAITSPALRSCGRLGHDEKLQREEFPEDFNRFLDEYIGKKEAEKIPLESVKRLRRNIRMFYRFLLRERGIKALHEIKKEDIREYIKYLTGLTDKDGSSHYLPITVNIHISDLKTWMLWLSRKGVCAGLSNSFKQLRGENHLSRNILTRKELVRLFGVKAENYREFMHKTIIILLYASGIRISEALGLKINDIGLENREALIYEPKTRKERIVQLGEVGTAYLRLYLSEVRDNINYSGIKSDHVFISAFEGKERRALMKKGSVNTALKKLCLKAGIKKAVTCHCFRHSFGTHLFENGAGIKQVCDLIGHSNIANTERYTRLSPEHLRQTIMKYHPIEKDSPFNKFKEGKAS